MTPDDLLQARRNALLVALIAYAVEIGGGEAAVQLPGGRSVKFDEGEVRHLRALAHEWFTLRDNLARGQTPLDDRPDRARQVEAALVELERAWPLALALRDACMGDAFEPLAPRG